MTTDITAPLRRTPSLLVKTLDLRSAATIEEACRINNEVWGSHLASTVDEFALRVRNGYVLGAFDTNGRLEGTLSIVRVPRSDLEGHGGASWTSTWADVTGNGTFSTNDPEGDTLCCVAVTARGRKYRADKAFATLSWTGTRRDRWCPEDVGEALGTRSWALSKPMVTIVETLAAKTVDQYLTAGLDPIMRFHSMAKGSLDEGAHVVRVLPHGRPLDLDALGYNVLMCYPELSEGAKVPVFTEDDETVGQALVVGAYRLASLLPGVRWVMPYSRPARFRKAMAKALMGKVKRPKDAKEIAFVSGVIEAALTILDRPC